MTHGCRYEPDVIRGATDDRWNDSLRAHALSCDECAAAVAAQSWMHRFAAIDDRTHILPNPSIVWLKAQLLQQTKTVERATRPMTVVQTAAYVVVAVGWAALLTAKWSAIQLWMKSLSPAQFVVSASGANADSVSLTMTFFTVVALLTCATVTLALHTILAEE
jgi:hypothetical protein